MRRVKEYEKTSMDYMFLDMFICIYAVCSAGYICDYKSLADKYNSD